VLNATKHMWSAFLCYGVFICYLVCFTLADWSHGSRPFTGLTCSLVFML